jgi:hypothetical protein
MQVVENIVQPVQQIFVKNVSPVLSNSIVHLLISWVIIYNVIYSIDERPVLKQFLLHPIVKGVSLFLAFYYTTDDFVTALAITIGIVVVFWGIHFFKESFSLINLTPEIYPGCANTTVKDLLDLFNGDQVALKNAMYSYGVPLDWELNDTNAPRIGTMMINFNKNVTATCRPPGV